jgi:pimeloyl-ACP methyl ester carboxylesterase
MEKFSITNRYGLKIVGDLHIPENPVGLVFIAHGLAGYKEELGILKKTEIFLNNKYTVVTFDFTNSRGESDGKYENTTVKGRYEDLCDLIDWAKSQTWYIEPFVLVGMSLGGYVVTKYAEENPRKVKALFPFATTISGEITVATMAEYKPEKLKNWKESGWFIYASKSQPGLELRLPWSFIEELLNHDLRPNAHNLSMPVLLMAGDKDTSCPLKYQKVLFDLLPENTERELHIIKGAEHTFYADEHLDELGRILDAWIKKLK